jgi:hypothetical protein
MGQAEEERAMLAEPNKPALIKGDFQDAAEGRPAV